MTLHTPGTTIKFRVTRLYIPDIASPITAAGTVILTIAGWYGFFCFCQYWMVYRYHGVPPYLRAPKGVAIRPLSVRPETLRVIAIGYRNGLSRLDGV
jgi:hypothetical protein